LASVPTWQTDLVGTTHTVFAEFILGAGLPMLIWKLL